MQSPLVLKARLVHAEAGRRVVQVNAWSGSECLGSSLGEADTAETAEDRARQRLLRQLEITPSEPMASPAEPALATDLTPSPAPARSALIRHGSTPVRAREEVPAPAAGEGVTAPQEPQPDPEDWSEELAALDVQLQRLGWDRTQEGQYLERCFGHPSRSRITSYADLLSYLRGLRGVQAGTDPLQAAVPLRRGDLLQQSDQLLQALRWDAAQGRGLLEQHFQLSSRQQLNDEQLLQFNMLLEGELIQAGNGQPAAAAPA